MKTAFIVSGLLLISAPAFASKARLQSLQKAEFLKDPQTLFVNPAHLNSIAKQMTVEFGAGANTSSPKAEGGIFTDMFGANTGIYLGHVSQNQKDLRAINGYENQNNPVEIFYAQGAWGASLAVSNFNDKTTNVKEQSLTARFGMDEGGREFYVNVEALAKAENATKDKFRGSPAIDLGYEQEFGSNYFFAKANWGAGENKTAAGVKTDIDTLGLEAGILTRKLQNTYFGASLAYDKVKTTKAKTALTLPLFAGVEADLTSWAVVRASITQSLLISQTQDKTATAPGDKKIINKNDTTVSAGVGLKYGKFALDGVVSGSTTGDLNGNAVLSQASLSYVF